MFRAWQDQVASRGMPHHVTQRGNRRQQTFFNDGDYAAYLELMAEWCRERGGGDLGLLPDAQSHPSDRGAADRGRLAAGHRRGASALHAADQFPREVAGLSVARAVRFVRVLQIPIKGELPCRS